MQPNYRICYTKPHLFTYTYLLVGEPGVMFKPNPCRNQKNVAVVVLAKL